MPLFDLLKSLNPIQNSDVSKILKNFSNFEVFTMSLHVIEKFRILKKRTRLIFKGAIEWMLTWRRYRVYIILKFM